jgi:tyrosine-protein phosphatase YwqE
MNLSEQKAKYETQYDNISKQIEDLKDKIQKANIALEQVRGAWLAIAELERLSALETQTNQGEISAN